jgi:hypothetical protein
MLARIKERKKLIKDANRRAREVARTHEHTHTRAQPDLQPSIPNPQSSLDPNPHSTIHALQEELLKQAEMDLDSPNDDGDGTTVADRAASQHCYNLRSNSRLGSILTRVQQQRSAGAVDVEEENKVAIPHCILRRSTRTSALVGCDKEVEEDMDVDQEAPIVRRSIRIRTNTSSSTRSTSSAPPQLVQKASTRPKPLKQCRNKACRNESKNNYCNSKCKNAYHNGNRAPADRKEEGRKRRKTQAGKDEQRSYYKKNDARMKKMRNERYKEECSRAHAQNRAAN